MDDLHQEMGWDLVCEESLSYPGKRSRLNNHEDVCLMLNRNTDAPRLKLLILSHSQNLTSLPDLSCFPCLEVIDLEDCINLSEIPSSIQHLDHLCFLCLRGCESLGSIPSSICSLRSLCLQSLEAVNCKQLQSLPDTSELAEVVTKRFIKEYERAFPVSICLPGSVIPDWFNHQSIGSSITIQLPGHNSKLVGFALCIVIAFEKYCDDGHGVQVSFKSDYGDTIDFCGSLTVCDTKKHNHAVSIYSDHIIQGYYPISNVTGFLTVEFYPQNFDGQPLQGCKVKNCAVCPLYAEELTETRKFSDETDTTGSESDRFDVEEMDLHPKIVVERKSALLIDSKVVSYYRSFHKRVGLLLFYCWSFILCLFCGIFVLGLLGFLVLHLSTRCGVYLSSHVQNMQGR
ncbi:hypothetical protein JRO89_XS07G0280600 [Xanthoceras sorbifolium]|uniref:C-JID domain-containing protein n=1 Tax=Xanthoceras sorbifolium TaxID=99658 RepID=A0ABQ8HVH2_9ROSI|nr:hypothetical protein JRO89_XS07G0280600 [Xanthoceras sorbifolium]